MSLVTFKDLCIDVNDSRPASEFWARTLGLELTGFDDDPDEFKLVGPTPAAHRVAERRARAARGQESGSPRRLRRLARSGARPRGCDESTSARPVKFRWNVFADPEGNEFCVFVVDDVPDYQLKAVEVDAADPEAIGPLVAGVAGRHASSSDEKDDWHSVSDIDGVPFEGFDFGPVPEAQDGQEPRPLGRHAQRRRRHRGPRGRRRHRAAPPGRRDPLDDHGRPGGQRVLRLRGVTVRWRYRLE